MSESEKLLEKFLTHLRDERGASSHTLRNYASDLQQFTLFLSSFYELPVSLERATNVEIRAWLHHLYAHSEPSSRARKLAALRSFYRFLLRNNIIASNPALAIATPKRRHRLPEQAPVTTLLPALNQLSRLLPDGDRDTAIIEVCYAAGLRTSEVTDLNVRDFDSLNSRLSVHNGQQLKRIVPINKHAALTIQHYLRIRSKGTPRSPRPYDPLFCNDNGGRLSASSVRRLVKKHIRLNPRVLRHSFAGHMLSNGIDPRHLEILLGHTTVKRTAAYAATLAIPAQKFS